MFDFLRHWFSPREPVSVTRETATVTEAPVSYAQQSPAPPDLPGYSLRRAKLDDLNTLMELERLSGCEDLFDRTDIEMILDEPKRFRVVIACFAGDPVGFMAACRRKKDWWIGSLTVLPAHRREGYGSRILDYFKDLYPAQADYKVYAKLRESEKEAQLFFKANGFLCIGYGQVDFSEPPEPALYFLWSR